MTIKMTMGKRGSKMSYNYKSDKREAEYLCKAGTLSDVDIKEAIKNLDILITSYDKGNLTPLGYNLTPTRFIFSIKRRTIEKLRIKNGLEFVYIRPNDTVLVLSRESVFISDKIMGTFHSKVKMVSNGFGHVATTLDPFWEGPLLFAVNNPTSKRLLFPIQKVDKDSNTVRHYSFVTLIFQSLISKSSTTHDNLPLRIEILKGHIKGKYHVYRNLRKFCEKIEDLIRVPLPLFKDKYNEIYPPKKDNIDKIEEARSQFNSKYSKYLSKINNIIDEIQCLNKFVVFFNLLKKLGRNILIVLFYIIGIILLISALANFDLLGLSTETKLTIALTAISVSTGISMYKLNKNN